MEIDATAKAEGGPRVLLRSGHWMPLMGLGTYKIVGDQVEPTVDAALAAGYRHFDTAKLYENERELGAAFEKLLPKHNLKREDIFITTKFWAIVAEKAAEEVPKLIDESLDNFRTNYIDLVLIHYPKPEQNANEDAQANAASRRECWRALEKIPVSKVRSIGVSSFEVRHLEELRVNGGQMPAVNQLEFHPHFRRADIKQYCAEQGIHFQAFSPLARQKPELLGDPVVVELCNKYETTAQKILLSFALSQGVGVVPKSVTPERLRANMDALDIRLSAQDLDALNAIPERGHYIRPTPWLVH